MTPRKPVVVVGSLNMDLVSGAARIPRPGETVTGRVFATYPGGKGANQATAVARLGYSVAMVGCVGGDVFGAGMRENLAREGVDVHAVETVSGPSGIASIVVSEAGENAIVVTPGANASLTPAVVAQHAALIRGAACVLLQLECPLETVEAVAEICSEADVPVILDPAPAVALPNTLWRKLTWFTPNESEAAFYAPEARGSKETVASLRQLGVSNVVLKRGEAGAYLARDGEERAIAPYAVTAVDSTAAGDCFNGAFAVAMASGMGPVEAAELACAAAAISVTRHGSQASMPTLDEVHALMAQA